MESLDRNGRLIAGMTGLMLLIAGSAAFGDEIDKKIDVEAARALAYEAIRHGDEGAEMWKFPDDYAPPFIVFEGDNFQRQGSPVVGHFAVNPWTGDVRSTGGFCRRLSTPTLKDMQAKIRQSFSGKERKAYDRLHKLRPWCDADPME